MSAHRFGTRGITLWVERMLFAAFLVGLMAAALADEVVIRDPALRSEIWRALGKPPPVGMLTDEDMLTLRELDISNPGSAFETYFSTDRQLVRHLNGLEAARNLTTLKLGGNPLADFSPLSGLASLATLDFSVVFHYYSRPIRLTNLTLPPGLVRLTTLNVAGNALTNLTLPADLRNLTTLILSQNPLADLSFLAPFTNLRTLDLSSIASNQAEPAAGREFTRLALPSSLTNLTALNLRENRLTDLSVLRGFTGLTNLNISYNRVSDFSFLSGMARMAALNVADNHLTSLALPENLNHLVDLDLSENYTLTNLSLPAELAALTTLNLASTRLLDFSFLARLTNLNALDLTSSALHLPLRALAPLTRLVSLELGYNGLSRLDLPAGLTNLMDGFQLGQSRALYVGQDCVSACMTKLRSAGLVLFSAAQMQNVFAFRNESKH